MIVAHCEVTYTARLNAYGPESMRLPMVKADVSVPVHAVARGFKPLNSGST
jgi:RecB family endonuclease NucS